MVGLEWVAIQEQYAPDALNSLQFGGRILRCVLSGLRGKWRCGACGAAGVVFSDADRAGGWWRLAHFSGNNSESYPQRALNERIGLTLGTEHAFCPW